MQADEPVDLTNCDREPIHIPGSIQTHGCLLACDAGAQTILRHSANAFAMLGIDAIETGMPLDTLLGPEAAHRLRNAIPPPTPAPRPALIFDCQLPNGKAFNVALHEFRSTLIIEFEPAAAQGQPLPLVRDLVARVSDIKDIGRLIQQSARLIRATLGYDRVMVYRFEQDGAGKVVAEVKRGDLESFLGQYFPATDIPQQARALYLRNTIRIISDASGDRIRIVPTIDASGEPLDLSFAHLRSVSPIHCEYLRNMGVAASMSISVIIDGALWGLIACHHYSPKVLPMEQRVAAEMFGEFFSLQLHALKQKRMLEGAKEARRTLDRFLRLASHHEHVDDLLRDSLGEFCQLLPCDGIGLWMNGKWSALKSTPPAEAIPALAKFVNAAADGKVWATHSLAQRLPAADDFHDVASGVLAVPLSQFPRDYLFFFRKEYVQTLEWGGNPEKSYEIGPLGDRLTPRRSFAIWKETVRKQAQPWTDADRETAEAARAATVEVVLRHNEMMADERSKADVRQRMLNDELNHRVKNILAVIKSVVGHAVPEGRNLQDYVASLKGRIQSLSFAHDQVVRGDGGGLLDDLLNAELGPYRSGRAGRVALAGTAVWLDSRAFSVMALVLHELATNAAKYGALSIPAGQLDVAWQLLPSGDCEITWRESGGPAVRPPSRQGFGTALINRSIPYDVGGESEIAYAPEGFRARFVLPAKHVAATNDADPHIKIVPDAERGGKMALPAGTSVLLVEDQMLIAMDVEVMLDEHGAAQVLSANSATEALTRLRDTTPDIAILDVNLGQDTSLPVADELQRRSIPFVFATGYGDGSMIPGRFSGTTVIRKPYDATTLLAALTQALRRRASL